MDSTFRQIRFASLGARLLTMLVAMTLLQIVLGSAPAHAEGVGISVAPRRLELDARTRSAELTVVNQGRHTRTYRISLKTMRMTHEGILIDAQGDPDIPTAHTFVRYSPRQVVLRPGDVQKVRVLVRLSPETPPGEYRSHLHFQALPEPDDPASRSLSGAPALRLRMIGAVTIPLIVRHDVAPAQAALHAPRLIRREGGSVLRVELARSGERSTYGDVEVLYRAWEDSVPTVVGLVRGVAIYTELRRRKLEIVLDPPPGVTLSTGTLQIVFREREGGRDRGDVSAAALLRL